MSFKIIGAAFDLPLVGNDKLVFLALCENADDTTRTCWPSYSTIQKKASLANSSLKTALEVLKAIGLISIKIRSTKGGGGRTSNLYKISEFDVEKFDVKNYKKTAKEIRAVRNYRESKGAQPPKIDKVSNHTNLRKSAQMVKSTQPPKIGTILDTQPPKIGEEPLAFSFQPLALREEEEKAVFGAEVVISIPSQLYGLTKDEIVNSVKELTLRKRPSDPSSYEARLLAQVESGDRRTCKNILKILSESEREAPWARRKRRSRELGEGLQAQFQQAGFENILDYLKNRENIK